MSVGQCVHVMIARSKTSEHFVSLMGIRVFLFSILTLVSCSTNKEQGASVDQIVETNVKRSNTTNASPDILNDHTMWVHMCEGLEEEFGNVCEVTTPGGAWVRFVEPGDPNEVGDVVEWGKGGIRRTSNDLETTRRFCAFVGETEDYILLRFGCGSPCYYLYVLPLDSIRDPIQRYWPLESDLQNNLVLFGTSGMYRVTGDTLVTVENLITMDKAVVTDTTVRGIENGVNRIDSLSLNDGTVFLRYVNRRDDTIVIRRNARNDFR